MSNYGGELTAAEAACFKEAGYGLVIIGTQRREAARQQLRAAVEAGLSVEAYVYLWWGGDVREKVQAALDLCSGFPIRRLWLDCEDNGEGAPGVPAAGSGFTPAIAEGKIRAGLAACSEAGVASGLYSAAWWWRPAMEDSQAFADQAWWVAFYDGLDDPTMWGPPFAGILQPLMKQYQGTTTVCGQSVDLNGGVGVREIGRAHV